MATKRLLGLLALVVVGVGVLSACGASASTELSRKATSETCNKDRSGGGCDRSPIGESPDLIFSADGRNAYLLLSVLPEAPERSGIWIYDRDPTTGSLVQKPGTAGCISEGRVSGCRPERALRDGVNGITVSSDGRNLYAATPQGVAVFERDQSNGTLSSKAGAEGCLTSIRKLIPTCAPARGLPGAGR